MAFFNKFPYHDYNDYNLDWVISTVKNAVEEWAAYRTTWEEWKNDISTQFEALYNYTHEYLDNLDITQEVRDYIDTLIANGTMRRIVSALWAELANDQAVLSARLDALEAGTTPAGAEVTGIRTGYNSQTYDTAGTAVREQVTTLHDGLSVLAEYGRELLDPKFNAGYLDGTGGINASTTRSTTDIFPALEGMRIFNNGANLVYVGCYSDASSFIERRTISVGSGLTLSASFVQSYPYIRVSIYNVDRHLVYITNPITLATREYVGRNGADYNVDPITGNYITFSSITVTPYTITIDTNNRTDGLLVTDPSGGTGVVSAGALNWPYQLANNQILIYNINNRQLEVTNASGLSAYTDPYVILIKNHYGRPKGGNWFRLYLAWQIRQIDTGAGFPAYYSDYMLNKVNTISDSMDAAGASGETFVFITDTHWPDNQKHSPGLVKYVADHAPITTVIHGGDVPTAFCKPAQMYNDVMDERAAFSIGKYQLYRTIGNHDMYCADPDLPDSDPNRYTYLNNSQVTGRMTAYLNQVSWGLHFGPNRAGNYYYWDVEETKIRFIILNNYERPNESYMSPEQLTWFAQTLADTPTGWCVYVIGHCAIIPAINTNYYAAYTDCLAIINAAANGTSVTYGGTTYDYSAKALHIIAYHCGHYHHDALVKAGNINHVVTRCDAFYNSPQYPEEQMTRGTVTEQAFDVVTINQDTKTVTLERIGAGAAERRTFTYA